METEGLLSEETWKVIFGFLLTTVAGGAVATYFQNRIWNHQWRASVRADQKREAQKVFDEISSLLDRRLYRYRQIVYALRTKDQSRIEKAFDEYRVVLFEWNDNLNRNYARIEMYYGKEMREELEKRITKDLIFIGTLLEREKKGLETKIGMEEVWTKIDDINGRVYSFDKKMISKLKKWPA